MKQRSILVIAIAAIFLLFYKTYTLLDINEQCTNNAVYFLLHSGLSAAPTPQANPPEPEVFDRLIPDLSHVSSYYNAFRVSSDEENSHQLELEKLWMRKSTLQYDDSLKPSFENASTKIALMSSNVL